MRFEVEGAMLPNDRRYETTHALSYERNVDKGKERDDDRQRRVEDEHEHRRKHKAKSHARRYGGNLGYSSKMSKAVFCVGVGGRRNTRKRKNASFRFIRCHITPSPPQQYAASYNNCTLARPSKVEDVSYFSIYDKSGKPYTTLRIKPSSTLVVAFATPFSQPNPL